MNSLRHKAFLERPILGHSMSSLVACTIYALASTFCISSCRGRALKQKVCWRPRLCCTTQPTMAFDIKPPWNLSGTHVLSQARSSMKRNTRLFRHLFHRKPVYLSWQIVPNFVGFVAIFGWGGWKWLSKTCWGIYPIYSEDFNVKWFDL